MHDQHSNSQPRRFGWMRRAPFSLIAAVTAIALASGSGAAWWVMSIVKSAPPASPPAQRSEQPAAPTPAAPAIPFESGTAQSPTAPTATPAAPAAEQTVQIYWLKDEGGQLKLVAAPIALPADQAPEARLRSALEALLRESPTGDAASTIPAETTLRSVAIRSDGVHVDLSADFKTGGGSASMSGRLGQIVYTATTIDPDAKVWISIEGEPLEWLGGEGIEVEQPMTRQSFDQNFAL